MPIYLVLSIRMETKEDSIIDRTKNKQMFYQVKL